MSSPALHLVIDARPRGPRGLLATEILLGRPVLSHLVEQALDGGISGRSDRSPCPGGRACPASRADGRSRLEPGHVLHGAAPGRSRHHADRPAL